VPLDARLAGFDRESEGTLVVVARGRAGGFELSVQGWAGVVLGPVRQFGRRHHRPTPLELEREEAVAWPDVEHRPAGEIVRESVVFDDRREVVLPGCRDPVAEVEAVVPLEGRNSAADFVGRE
jgi:hypothetical protein